MNIRDFYLRGESLRKRLRLPRNEESAQWMERSNDAFWITTNQQIKQAARRFWINRTLSERCSSITTEKEAQDILWTLTFHASSPTRRVIYALGVPKWLLLVEDVNFFCIIFRCYFGLVCIRKVSWGSRRYTHTLWDSAHRKSSPLTPRGLMDAGKLVSFFCQHFRQLCIGINLSMEIVTFWYTRS